MTEFLFLLRIAGVEETVMASMKPELSINSYEGAVKEIHFNCNAVYSSEHKTEVF